jgi:hypothetical protein
VRERALEGSRLPDRQMSRCRPRGGLLICALPLVLSCGSKGAVAVTASVTNLTVSLNRASPLAAELDGGFDLHLDLGQYAPQGTDVALMGNFQLVRPADQSAVVLLATYASAAFPYHLEPGASADVHFTIGDRAGAAGQTIATDASTSLCQAGSVALSGSITDSASGQHTPLAGAATSVAGCP